MRFLLVYPPLKSYTNYWHPHLGLRYLSAILSKNGVQTKIIDCVANKWDHLDFEKSFVKTQKPDAVLITATTSEINSAHKIASIVKRHDKHVMTIIGGPHTTAEPELTLKQFKDFDIAVIGEGEYTILDIRDYLENKKPLNKIKGIAYHQDNSIFVNEKNDIILDLDKLPPPDWKKFPIKRYRSYLGMRTVVELPIITGRGCPNQCVFCQRALGQRVRVRSISYVIEEIQKDIELGAESIYFCDETFSLFKKRTIELLNEMWKRNIDKKVFWHCETRVDSVDEKVLSSMKKAGCKMIHFGVESGSNAILKKCKKGINRKQIITALELQKDLV